MVDKYDPFGREWIVQTKTGSELITKSRFAEEQRTTRYATYCFHTHCIYRLIFLVITLLFEKIFLVSYVIYPLATLLHFSFKAARSMYSAKRFLYLLSSVVYVCEWSTCLQITVSDRPGGIAELCNIIAKNGGSMKDIFHERAWLKQDIFSVRVSVTKSIPSLKLQNTFVNVNRSTEDTKVR